MTTYNKDFEEMKKRIQMGNQKFKNINFKTNSINASLNHSSHSLGLPPKSKSPDDL